MHTNTIVGQSKAEWKFKWIFWAQVFLFLGVLSSPTIVSLFHIIIIIPTLILWFKNPLNKLPKSAWCLIGLTVWGLISTLYNLEDLVKPRKSFGELKYYLLGVLLIHPLNYFLSLDGKAKIKTFLNVFWVIIILAFFVGLSRTYLKFDPVTMSITDKYHPFRSGGFLNYMRYGYASAFIFLLGVSAFFNREKLKSYIHPVLFHLAMSCSFLAILVAQTRGALLALIFGIPFVLWRYKRKWAYYVIGIGAIFVSIVYYFSFVSTSPNRFLNIKGNSNQVRMSQFQSALKSIQERPLLGLGADQFSYNVKRLKEKYNLYAKHYASHSHNILLEHAANYGLVGLMFLVFFFLFWFVEMTQMHSAFGWAIASYILAFFISGQVELLFDNANSHILFYIYTFSQTYRGRGNNFEL